MKLRHWSYKGYSFDAEILPPKKGQNQEIKLVPILPQTGQRLTKRQMGGNDSDQAYKVVLTGKDERFIKTKLFPKEAENLIQKMQERNLLSTPELFDDLYALAERYAHEFIEIEEKEYRWKPKTVDKYTSQFRLSMPDMKGLQLSDMTLSDYVLLQNKICRTANLSSRTPANWQPGDLPPASGITRLRLLYLFLWFLKSSGICDFDFIPTIYKGKASRRDQLLPRTSRIRSLPPELIQKLLVLFDKDLPAQLLIECGLRINEYSSLLWCNLIEEPSSQGPVYVLRVTGQLNSDGHYVDYGKSNSAYRHIPVSEQLGEKLIAWRKVLEAQCHRDLSQCYLCGYVEQGQYVSTSAYRQQHMRKVEKEISAFLRRDENMDYSMSHLKFVIADDPNADKITQQNCVRDSLSPHALRRNKDTADYVSSGISSLEIYQQMGHSPKNLDQQPAVGGKTKQELIRMCLAHKVSSTPFHPQQPLHYALDGSISRSEVPACDLVLSGQKGQSVELMLYPTELNTTLQLDLPDGVTIEQTDCFELEELFYPDAVCFSEQDYKITSTSFPFRKEK